MYAGRGSDKNRSYMNAQQCFHFRGSRLRIAVVGCGICGTLFLIRSLTDFFRDPLAAGGNRVPLPCTWKQRLSPVSMYAGRGSGKNRSYMNAQQCSHLRGSRLRIAVAGWGICGTLFLIRSLADFFRDPLAAGGNRVPLPRTWKQRLTVVKYAYY